MHSKAKRIRYPFSRYILSGCLAAFYSRWQKNPLDQPFDLFLHDLAYSPGAGLRGRLILRGLESYRIQFESLAVPDPFGSWLINQIRS